MGNYTRQSYHSSRPAWRNTRNLTTPAIGIEFETEASHYMDVLALLPNFRKNRPITESDGSLSDNGGVEIIFPPIHPSQLKSARGTFARAIKAIAPVCWGDLSTGMHMNVNVYTWTDDAINTFLAVVNNLPREYLENIGGRRLTHYCSQERGFPVSEYKEVLEDSHTAATYHFQRIEVRFPQSTTDLEEVRGLIDFITTLSSFAKTKGKRFIEVVEGDYTKEENDDESLCMCYECRRNRDDTYDELMYDDGLNLYYKYLSKTKKGQYVLSLLERGHDASRRAA